MIEERYIQFEFPYDDFAVKDIKTDEELWNPQIVDRLNKQSHMINNLCYENKQLKDLIIHLGYTIKYTGYGEVSLERIERTW